MSKLGLSLAAAVFLQLGLGGCGGSDAELPLRLVDALSADSIEGALSGGSIESHARWSFAGAADTLGWKAGQGVEGLAVRDGRLVGKASTAAPALYVKAPDAIDPKDGLHAIEVVLKTDQGGQAHASVSGAEPKFETAVKPQDWTIHADLKPGAQAQTLTLRDSRAITMDGAKFLMLTPTDVVGGTFEIESVRLITQREHRASSPSGVGWQGLGAVYHETIVSRAPESFSIPVDILPGAFLDLSVGTVEQGPVTFRIDAIQGGEERELFRRTVTTPHRWHPARLELTELRGAMTLRFSLANVDDYATGFWGSPVVRVRGAAPKTDLKPAEALGGAKAPLGVIVFLADTLRTDHLPFHGYERPTAPYLTSLVGEGAVFLDNISQATWTKVSVPSIMTSLYPTSHRITVIPDRISVQANTLAESYRAAGYATASFPSNSFAGMMTNLHQGFEESHERDSFDRDGYRSKTARRVVDHSLEWIERKKDVPFFAYIHVLEPHSPFEPRDPYKYRWASREGRAQHDAEWEKVSPAIQSDFLKNQKLAMPEELRSVGVDYERWLQYEKDWYDGSILGMDAEVRRVHEKLVELGIADRVLFAFISDHGEEFLEHGQLFHGQSAYGDLANVPLALRYPGVIPAGVRIDTTVRSIDLMPTLLALSGLAAPEGMQGQSLLPLIAAASKGVDPQTLGWRPQIAVTEKATREDTSNPITGALESYAMVSESGEWKLVHNAANFEKVGRPEYELYRHKEDPLDLNNIAAERPDVVQALATEVKAWKGMVTQSQLPKAQEGVGDDVTPEQLNQLRNLGYIQ